MFSQPSFLEDFDVHAYGAVGGGTVDDTVAIQAAITAAAVSGGRVYFPNRTYKITGSGLSVPASVRLVGSGQQSTILSYTGTGTCITLGSRTAAALSYGCTVEEMRINLTQNAGNGIEAAGTGEAVLRNLYIEGQSGAAAGTGVFLNGGTAANIFTRMDTVRTSHIFRGFYLGSVGGSGQVVTSVDAVGCKAVTDNMVGSIGIRIDAAHGQGSRFFGGNLESCATAISTAGISTLFAGIRFENTLTPEVVFANGASGNILLAPLSLAASSISDASGNLTNVVFAPMVAGTPAVPGPQFLGSGDLKIGGNVGFYNTAPAAKPSITGSRGANAALASLLTNLATLGLLTDSTTA